MHSPQVKRKLLKKRALSEEDFEAFAEGHKRDNDIPSISGPETESEDDEEKLETNFSTPFKHQGRKSVLFRLNSGQIISVWRCVLRDENGCEDVGTKEESRCLIKMSDTVLLSRLTGLVGSSATWVVLLAVGGHFAGIVMKLKGSGVIAHKTFHSKGPLEYKGMWYMQEWVGDRRQRMQLAEHRNQLVHLLDVTMNMLFKSGYSGHLIVAIQLDSTLAKCG